MLGSTGSIGASTLEVVSHLAELDKNTNAPRFEVVGLAAGRNAAVLARQARAFGVKCVALLDPAAADQLAGAMDDGLRKAKAFRDGHRIRVARLAEEQPIGGPERLLVELAGGIERVRVAIGVGLEVADVGRVPPLFLLLLPDRPKRSFLS